MSVYQRNPKRVIIGNSITHYWNAEEGRNIGTQSWNKFMEQGGYLNLGYGWDKIDESLFTDGLHPNEKGYSLIAPFIVN